MYSPSNNGQYAQLQPNMYTQGESSGTLYNTQIPTNYSFSQPTTSQQIHAQNALIYARHPQNNIPILNPVQLRNVEQNPSSNSENQWQKVSRKKHRNLDDQKNLNATKKKKRLLTWRNNNNHQ
jgi:hypothetical protein